MGNEVTHTTFPLSFQSLDHGHPPRLQSTATLHPHVAHIPDQVRKRVREKSTRRSNQVVKLTDYHISRHVVSTFKSLTTTTTHCDLSISGLHRRDLNHEQLFVTPPVNLKFLQYVVELPEPIISRAAGNHIHLDLKIGVMRNHIHLDLKMEYMCGRFHLLYEHL